jgi:Fe-S-cluster containining protein
MEVGKTYNSDTEVIGLELDILGKKVNFNIAVSKGRVTLADIVPLAHTVCTKITDIVVESIHTDGGCVPCGKGCSACCGPYLVSLSVPEALWLNEEISNASQLQRESMWQACLLAARRILSQKPPESFMHQPAETSPIDLNLISSWYESLELSCPFLHNGLCSIYDQRPLACREHFIKGFATACTGERGIAEVVQMPIQMPNVLAQLAGELEGTSEEAVMLPLTLVWYEQNSQRAHRSWPALMMVKRFLEIIQVMASESSEAVVA